MTAIHLQVEAGIKEIAPGDLYLLLACWWAGLVCLYLYWFAETYEGKSKGKSRGIKALIMLWPNIFIVFSIYATCQFINNV